MARLGLAILVVVGLAIIGAFCSPRRETRKQEVRKSELTISVEPMGCAEHIELKSAAFWAQELGRPEINVLATYRINLWSTPAAATGRRKIGEMIPGSRAVIVERASDAYRVRSPLDDSMGWVSAIQVERTLWQDRATREACTPGSR